MAGHHLDRTGPVRMRAIEDGKQRPLAHGQQAGDQLDDATGRSQVAEIALGGRHRDGGLVQSGGDAFGFRLVTVLSATPMSMDMS